MIEGAIAFAVGALLGLFAAKRPQTFARYFLAEWQRQRLSAYMSEVSWFGWFMFGTCAWMVFILLLEAASKNW